MKTKAEKGKSKKDEETLKHAKPPRFRWGGVLWPFSTTDLGIF